MCLLVNLSHGIKKFVQGISSVNQWEATIQSMLKASFKPNYRIL